MALLYKVILPAVLVTLISLTCVHAYAHSLPGSLKHLRMARGVHMAAKADEHNDNAHVMQKRFTHIENPQYMDIADGEESTGHSVNKRSVNMDEFHHNFPDFPSDQSFPHIVDKRFFATSSRFAGGAQKVKPRKSSQSTGGGSAISMLSSLFASFKPQQIAKDFDDNNTVDTDGNDIERDDEMTVQDKIGSILSFLMEYKQPKEPDFDEKELQHELHKRFHSSGDHLEQDEHRVFVKRYDPFMFKETHTEMHASDMVSRLLEKREEQMKEEAEEEAALAAVHQAPLHHQRKRNHGEHMSERFAAPARRSGSHYSALSDGPSTFSFDLIPRHPLTVGIKHRRSGPGSRPVNKGPEILGVKRSLTRF